MRGRARLVILVAAAVLSGCPTSSRPNDSPGEASNAVEAELPATPVVVDLTEKMEAAAEAAALQTAYHDGLCAAMTDMSAELDANRPTILGEQKGCPRPGAPGSDPATWGAN
jgi:hypothetical protein